MEEGTIELRCTIELLAKPQEAATQALKKIVENLEENGKKLEVSMVEYAEPQKVEQDFFSAYATFNVKAEINEIFGFILDYAPSVIEVINTSETKVSSTDLQGILNDMSGRLNEMDKNIKIFSAQNIILSKENEELKKKLNSQ
jgi:nucleoside diphosphate kinase